MTIDADKAAYYRTEAARLRYNMRHMPESQPLARAYFALVREWAEHCGFVIENAGMTTLRLHLKPRPYSYRVSDDFVDELAKLSHDVRGREIIDTILAGEWNPSAFDDVQLQQVEAAALEMLMFVERRQNELLAEAAARMKARIERAVAPVEAQESPQPVPVAAQPR